MKLKILMPGIFWRGSREFSYKTAFENLGCQVFAFNLADFFPDRHGKTDRFLFEKIKFKLKRLRGTQRLNQVFTKLALELNPDLIFILKGRDLSPRTLKQIRKWNTSLIFNFNPDDFFAPRYPKNSSPGLIKSIPLYDCIFTPKSYNIRKELLLKGARRVEYLPFGYDPEINRPVKLLAGEKELYRADVVFVGSPEKERAAVLEKVARAGFDLKVYGPGWEKVPKTWTLRKCLVGRPAYGEEMAKVYAAAKIVLAFMRRGDRDLSNPRMFEVPACGAFMAIERTREVLNFFQEGSEVICFEDFKELKLKLDYYLKHSQERKKIAEAGYQKVTRQNWSYKDRAQRILEVFSGLESAQTLIKN